MTKQANNSYRPSNAVINNVCVSLESQATGAGKLIGQFRTLVDKGANPSEVLSRIMCRLHSLYPSDTSLGNTSNLGVRWGYAVEAYRQAYAETGQTLQRVSNAKLKGYVADYKPVKSQPKASKPAEPKNRQGESPKQSAKRQAEILAEILPYASQLSTGKLKTALAGVDSVSAVLLAARILEATTGQPAVFPAVLNEYTEQKRKGAKRTLKVA